MPFTFQILSACVEDKYPRGYHAEDRERLLEDNFMYTMDKVQVEKRIETGCVALLFGRSTEGKSVCVRVEGFRPKLFFLAREGDTVLTVREELEAEVKHKLAMKTLAVRHVHFCHLYKYEPDLSQPSGRKVHGYFEVAYPNLASWREAVRLRRGFEYDATRRKLAAVKEEAAALHRLLEATKSKFARDGRQADRVAHSILDAEHARLVDTVPQLESRVDFLRSGGNEEEEELPDSVPVCPRPAHEACVEPLTRFFHEHGIGPVQWVDVKVWRDADERISTCDEELVVVDPAWIQRNEDVDGDSEYKVMYYDIETKGLDPETTPCIQVSLVFAGPNGKLLSKHCVCVGSVTPTTQFQVVECTTEAQLLRHMRAILVKEDPDFLVAYNGVNFDNRFLAVRATRGHADERDDVVEFFHLSRLALRRCSLRELKLSSSGMGDNLLRYFDAPGRGTFDWFVKLKRDLTSEPSYSLGHFGVKFCGVPKDDVAHQDIAGLQDGSAADRFKLAKYCVKDSDLLRLLDSARTMTTEILQFSLIFGVIPEWVYFRGQQVRFIVQLLEEARRAEEVPLLLNTPPEGFHGGSKYEGATVNQPIRGFFKKPVFVLDWMSLYPSIMIDHNLDFSTYVTDPALFGTPGVVEHRISDTFVTHFVKPEVKRGILPLILIRLLEKRKQAKKKVKEHKELSKDASLSEQERKRHGELSNVWDGRQLALKVGCNSVYGACGASEEAGGKFPLQAISATTTFQGREAMVIKKKILPERFPGIEIIYGDTDSVMVTFDDVGTLEACLQRGEEAAEFVTNHFASMGLTRMILEFEKVYLPYLLENKKRYAGLKYEPDKGKMVEKGIDCKGIETERKDTMPFTQSAMNAVLDVLLYKADEVLAFDTFKEQMKILTDDKVPFSDYVMKKNLSSKVEGKTDTIAQARVNALRKERNPGSEAAVGTQVEFVFVNGHPKSKTTELAEDPAYVQEHGLKINRSWYFEHRVVDPLKKIFELFPQLPFDKEVARIKQELESQRLGVSSVLRSLVSSSKDDDEEWFPPPLPVSAKPPWAAKKRRTR